MPKCYDPKCEAFVSEKFTYCDECKEKHYPSSKSSSSENLKRRALELAKTAPVYIPPPIVVNSPRTTKNQLCTLCPEKKKNPVTIKIDNDNYICWGHKTQLELAHGSDWKWEALKRCKEIHKEQRGEQTQLGN